MIKKIILVSLVSAALLSCKGQNKEVSMDNLIKEKLALTQEYSSRPLFGAQVNKTACKIIIENEGGIDYRLTDNAGESMMIPLNVLILKKGKQKLKISVYPRDGEQFLTKYATASVTIYRSPDKDSSMKDYQKLGAFELPINIEEKKLPSYDTTMEFDADVPYDYQKEIDAAKDLSKIPGIEKKVVEKYNKLRNMGIKTEEDNYLFEIIHQSGIFYNTLYTNTYNEIKKNSSNKRAVIDNNPSITNREFIPIKNYTLRFYANGKIAALWQENHRPMLYLTAIVKRKGEESKEKVETGDPIFLYMPAGSNELKIW